MKNNTEKTKETKNETPVNSIAKIEKTKSAPKSKKSSVEKSDAPKAETKKSVGSKELAMKSAPEKIDLSKIAPLKVDKKLLDEKIAALGKKLEKEKLTTTKNAFHVSYGYFLCKAKSGKILTIEYHEKLKPAKWLVRGEKGEVLTPEPIATLWKAHETAVYL